MSAGSPRLFAVEQEQVTSDDYYTPQWVFDAMGITFDLDVCSPPGGVAWIPATRYFTMADDGLAQPWVGRVWMNPPYSGSAPWVERFTTHCNGVCLIPTSKSVWFYRLWNDADAIVYHHQTISFVGGQVFMPVCFAAFGDDCVEAISHLGRAR